MLMPDLIVLTLPVILLKVKKQHNIYFIGCQDQLYSHNFFTIHFCRLHYCSYWGKILCHRLSNFLAIKWVRSYDIVIGWIKAYLAFSILYVCVWQSYKVEEPKDNHGTVWLEAWSLFVNCDFRLISLFAFIVCLSLFWCVTISLLHNHRI